MIADMTVGTLKKLLNNLPDDAEIYPSWNDGPPSDEDPAVVIHGFTIDDG